MNIFVHSTLHLIMKYSMDKFLAGRKLQQMCRIFIQVECFFMFFKDPEREQSITGGYHGKLEPIKCKLIYMLV